MPKKTKKVSKKTTKSTTKTRPSAGRKKVVKKRPVEFKEKTREIKSKKEAIQILRGMQDILPEDIRHWDYVFKKMIDISESYGFRKIIVPVLEKYVLFERSTGAITDVVEKQMYQFRDRAGNKVVLRPEFTPGVVRAYIERGMFNLPQPVKLYYFGPLFRYERPQAGRSRQFHQFGLEIIGSEKPLIDAQLILISQTLFNSLGIRVSIQINSLGCVECRKSYRSKLVHYFKFKKGWLCPDCHRRLNKNPLRILDCQKESCRNLIVGAPQLVDNLCDDCQNHFIKTLEYLDEANVIYEFNPYLVRGLDYYTRTVFEFWPDRSNIKSKRSVKNKSKTKEVDTADQMRLKTGKVTGSQVALGGGGRYDDLVENMGGHPTPASGLSYGIERIIEEVKVQCVKIPKVRAPQIFLAHIGEKASRRALKLFDELQRQGFKIAQNFTKDSLKAQMETANKLNVKLTLILGQQEVIDNTVIIRNMYSGNQEIVDQEKMVNELKKRL